MEPTTTPLATSASAFEPADDADRAVLSRAATGDLAALEELYELRAVADGYGPILNSLFHMPNNSPNNSVGDGVNANDQASLPAIQYIATPNQGHSHTHHAAGAFPLWAVPQA